MTVLLLILGKITLAFLIILVIWVLACAYNMRRTYQLCETQYNMDPRMAKRLHLAYAGTINEKVRAARADTGGLTGSCRQSLAEQRATVIVNLYEGLTREPPGYPDED